MHLSEKCGENTLLEKNVKEFRVNSDEIINVRDMKITNLEVKAKNLGMGIEELKVQLSTKCDENTLLEKEVKTSLGLQCQTSASYLSWTISFG